MMASTNSTVFEFFGASWCPSKISPANFFRSTSRAAGAPWERQELQGAPPFSSDPEFGEGSGATNC